MKKIFTFIAAMLVAFAANADPVVLPAVLDVTNVSFRSDNLPDFVIEEGQEYAGTYFDMGAHNNSNDTLLYAEWDVTIEPIKYNVAVDVYNTNSWRVQLDILNQSDSVVEAIRYKGSSEQKGQFSIGSLDLSDLEAGDYKVRARAATAWSAMKLKDIIITGDYQGVSVDLPGTLQPAYAELSSGASVANNAIAFAPSTANSEYATWNVSFAEAGTFNVTIDITASNCHDYSVKLLSADGETQIGVVAETGCHEDAGVKELGAIAVPAAGNYVVKLTNATQWSNAVLNSISFTAAPVTLYLLNAKALTEANAKMFVHAWGEGMSDQDVEMSILKEGNDTLGFSAKINKLAEYMIFVRMDGEAESINWSDNWGKTVELDRCANDSMYFHGWTTEEGIFDVKCEEPLTETVFTVVVPAATDSVFITGDFTDWGFVKMSLVEGEDSVYTYAAEGDVRSMGYKYTAGPDWAYEESNQSENRTYAVRDTVESFKAVPVEPTPSLADGYYLVGYLGGEDSWGVESLSEERMLIQNPAVDGEWMLDFTFGSGDVFKIVKVNNNAIETWYPEGTGTDYLIDAAHTGNKTIYFRPDYQGGEDWHNGCIYVPFGNYSTSLSANWSTICLPYTSPELPVDVEAYSIASIADGYVSLQSETSLTAGYAYLVKAVAEDNYEFALAGGKVDAPVVVENFVGNLAANAVHLAVNGEYDYYILLDNEFHLLAETATADVAQYKAYICLAKGSGAPVLRIAENATDIQNVEAGETAQKFILNGKVLILREGVVYDTTGRVVR